MPLEAHLLLVSDDSLLGAPSGVSDSVGHGLALGVIGVAAEIVTSLLGGALLGAVGC